VRGAGARRVVVTPAAELGSSCETARVATERSRKTQAPEGRPLNFLPVWLGQRGAAHLRHEAEASSWTTGRRRAPTAPGPRADTLAALPREELFDFGFIDVDKPVYRTH